MLELTNSLEQSTLPRDTDHEADPEPVGFKNDDVTTPVRKRARGKKPQSDRQADRSLRLRNDVDAAPVNKRRRPQFMERFLNRIMSRPKNSKGVPHWLKNRIQAFSKSKNRKGRRPGEGKEDKGGKNETDYDIWQSPGDYNTVGFFVDQGINTNNTSERDRDDINSDFKGNNGKGNEQGDKKRFLNSIMRRPGKNYKGSAHLQKNGFQAFAKKSGKKGKGGKKGKAHRKGKGKGDKGGKNETGNMEGKPSPRNSPGEYMSLARYIRIRGMSSAKQVNIIPGGFKAAMGAD